MTFIIKFLTLAHFCIQRGTQLWVIYGNSTVDPPLELAFVSPFCFALDHLFGPTASWGVNGLTWCIERWTCVTMMYLYAELAAHMSRQYRLLVVEVLATTMDFKQRAIQTGIWTYGCFATRRIAKPRTALSADLLSVCLDSSFLEGLPSLDGSHRGHFGQNAFRTAKLSIPAPKCLFQKR